MSKKSKKAASELKRRKKASDKAAQRAKYEGYRDSGKNSKSKRFLDSTKDHTKMRARTHPYGHCGNIGCKKCFPQYNIPELFESIRGLNGLNYALFD